jgi:hypothetical protein
MIRANEFPHEPGTITADASVKDAKNNKIRDKEMFEFLTEETMQNW